MTESALITETELKARRIIRDARQTDWSPCQQRILNFFQAEWSSAHTVETVTKVTKALHGPSGLSLQPFLTALARRKVLRSRKIRGVTHYEINLI